ncbi:MAG: methionine synthase [Bacteroidetes bacterium GWE2_29_8]|nr:MAG: methionine synthase [Bacteroidetes bacterium GWE2_29_8]OFY17619.1 MAG: methionine synthase [Bacteroidetes bacterium GWF2_29_10]
MNIKEILKSRILVLDGAMGTMIQRYSLGESDYRGEQFANHESSLKGNNDILTLTRPHIIKEIHKAYLESGADIIETNTFNSTRISQADYKTENHIYELNYNAARLAREAINELIDNGKPRYVAGSVGPTNKTLSISPNINKPEYRDVDFDIVVESYCEQIEGLIDGGIDLILIETVFDTLNCKAAIYAAQKSMEKKGREVPIMVSVTISDSSGRTLSGQTLEALMVSISHADLLSIGLNCALGAKQLHPYINTVSENAETFVCVYPNAGLPNELGHYDESAETMGKHVEEYLKAGIVNIIGGCCGTTPEHIKVISSIAKKYPPRKVHKRNKILSLSGLEVLNIVKESNFINIGERTNIAGSSKFAKAIINGDYNAATSIARQQVDAGAQIIDINLDDAMINGKEAITRFLNYIATEPEISRVPFMIDSSDKEVILAGLKCVQGKCIVNSISLKEGEEQFVNFAKELKRFGCAVVVMAFDEAGQATVIDRRIEIFNRAYKILKEQVGFDDCDIIYDPNILAIGTGIEEHNNYALDFINTVAWMKSHYPEVKISGGVSNLSFSFRGNNIIREAIHSSFLFHAIKAGMDMGIVNAGMIQIYDEIDKTLLEKVEDLIFNRRADATEELINYASILKNNKTEKVEKEILWRKEDIESRIAYSLINGIDEYISADMDEALQKYASTLNIIEGPLMDGMKIVGDKFGAGKMFLPQVVKTARVMKKAVEYLQPYILNADKDKVKTSGKILLATVKGDVHDIGKNIVGLILSCNNYEIIDMGVMVSAERIIEMAIKENVDMVGLSGLITPSLEEMINVASKMEKEGVNIPLLIGGATTSKLHTAVKIAPQYSSSVVYVPDASKSVEVVNSLLNKEHKASYTNKIKDEYELTRQDYIEKNKSKVFLTLEEANKNKLEINWDTFEIAKPKMLGVIYFDEFPISKLKEYIDWTFFFFAWDISGRYPAILEDKLKGEEAKKLLNDAKILLEQMINENVLKANAAIGLFPAYSENNDVTLLDRGNVLTKFSFLRNQQSKAEDEPNLCLADFICPKEKNKEDYIGLFVVSAGHGIEQYIERFKKNNDDYNAIMAKIITDRLAEAYTEQLHHSVRNTFWGYASEPNQTIDNLLKGRYQGIRPASGYPACPDHRHKKEIFNILKADSKLGIKLTENFSMYPAASVSGFYFANHQSKYFNVGKITQDQLEDYAKRTNCSIEETEKWLKANL